MSDDWRSEAAALGYDPDDPGLVERLVADTADDIEWLDRAKAQYPLATSLLWRADAAPWDQRRAVIAAMTSQEVALILGGERSGKSLGLKQLTVAQALGGDHPAVKAWLQLNDLPGGYIPDGPARVYVVARDSNASVRIHRPDFDALIGTGKTWYGQNYRGEGRLLIEVPGYTQRAEIWFKSIDQGADRFMGDSVRWWFVDEEPLGEDGRAIFGQLRARAMDQNGRGAIAMVPFYGFTWVYEELVRDHKYNAAVVELDVFDNPHLPADRRASHIASLSEQEKAIRRYGRFTSREGMVYASWVVGDGAREGMGHTCRAFEIPKDWPRFRGADFGLVNPTCVLWGALGDDGTLYVYRELYQAGPSYEVLGRLAKQMSAGERYVASWGDPSAKTVLEDTWPALDLYFRGANRDMRTGLDAVGNRLLLQADNRPRLKVFADACPNLVREMGIYARDPNAKDGSPLKRDDHAPDALRYMVVGVDTEFAGPR